MSTVSENELKVHQKNVGGKRVTLEDVEGNIKDTYYHVVEGSCLTICVLTLQNGFQVTGESACADPSMFNAEIGMRISRDNAIKKIWPLMGYVLKQEVYLAGGDFKDRVRQESKELAHKINLLGSFIDLGVQFPRLSDREQRLLVEQLAAMKDYYKILKLRIEEFK